MKGHFYVLTHAVIFEEPGVLHLADTALADPAGNDLVVESRWTGISTGTERLLWTGKMPNFPGMGYPLVPGYETVGEIVSAPTSLMHRIGETVFVAGCGKYSDVRGLFGGSASTLVVDSDKALKVDASLKTQSVLMALAATACHALAAPGANLPDLIVGNGVLGRLLARLTVALGGEPPTVWETNPARRTDDEAFRVVDPSEDEGARYATIFDVSGSADILDQLVGHLVPGGEIVLAGFYSDRLSFAFPPAFMKEARLRVAAEWKPDDMEIVNRLLGEGLLSLDGLITHEHAAHDAAQAYETAFSDAECLKMVLNWRETV
ncbi:chlorophyll synthesis pathway protein BchC [Pseudahrensia aquimaris]|uniref:Chlorophyll synthesis pathway protein BchC n=1 Tax=Pseudahrensia aquimaris TaxID=744461 RepID=A0ABW3FLR4_9HYPH